MITMRIKANEWHETSAELRRWKKFDVPQFIRYRARIGVQDLIKWTPPRGTNPGSESFRQQLARGQKTIRRDCNRTFTAVDQLKIVKDSTNGWASEALTKAVNEGDLFTVRGILTKLNFRPRGVLREPSRSIHLESRTRRGTVPKKQGWFVLHQRDIDMLAEGFFGDIGKAKSGWGYSAERLGVTNRNWPGWVRKHGNNGYMQDLLSDPKTPRLILINDRPEVKDMDQEEIVNKVMIINEIKLQKELAAILKWDDARKKIK